MSLLMVANFAGQQMSQQNESNFWRYALIGIAAFVAGRMSAPDSDSVRTQRQRQAFSTPISDGNAVQTQDVFYANCTDARAAGAAPISEGDPGYAPHLDRDGDGVACE
jgi:Flp pilus assembly protein TadD